MLVDTRAIGFALTDAILRHVESRVDSALGPFARWVVKATVRLNRAETVDEFRKRMRESLREQGFANFKIPQKVVLANKDLHTERFKQARQV